MKKFVVATMAMLIGLSPLSEVAQAQNRPPAERQVERHSPQQQIKKHKWRKGGKYSGRGSRVSDYRRHHLSAPPKGHRWVRDGDDFLLIAISTGIIASIVDGRN